MKKVYIGKSLLGILDKGDFFIVQKLKYFTITKPNPLIDSLIGIRLIYKPGNPNFKLKFYIMFIYNLVEDGGL